MTQDEDQVADVAQAVTETQTDSQSGGGTGDDGDKPTPVRIANPKAENELFYGLISLHPFTEFNDAYFVDLLEHSLSLSVTEKRRVIDSVPILSQFQIDELCKVFEEEREEFKKLLPTDGATIKDWVVKARDGWQQLKDIYTQEEAEAKKSDAEADEIEALRKSLSGE